MMSVLRAVAALAALALAECYAMWDLANWINWSNQLNITRAFWQSDCSALLNSTIADMQNVTVFAPTDQAWNRTFNMTDFTGFQGIGCENAAPPELCYQLLTQNLSTVRVEDIGPCLPLLSVHHIANGTYDKLFNATNHVNITVIPCGENQALQVNNINGNGNNSTFTKVVVANTTNTQSYVQGGGNSTAIITNTYPAADGRLYLIDRVLVPPLPLNYTLVSFNATQPFNTTLNDTMSSIQDRNITVFLPMNVTEAMSLNQTTSSMLNLTSFIVPEVVYLNQTSAQTFNLTTLDGMSIIFEVTENYTATLNGNVSVTRANIPLTNGVLHFVNGTIASANITNTAAARALRSNRDQWLRWLREHY